MWWQRSLPAHLGLELGLYLLLYYTIHIFYRLILHWAFFKHFHCILPQHLHSTSSAPPAHFFISSNSSPVITLPAPRVGMTAEQQEEFRGVATYLGDNLSSLGK